MSERSKSNFPGEEVLAEWDRRHSWHPFAQMQEYLQGPPIHIASGSGCWLTDTEGNRYLDGTASIWTNVHGHNDPDLNAALTAQLGRVAHSTMLGLSHPIGSVLGKRLAKISPGDLNRTFYSDNGSNAVEIALKMSLQYWQLQGNKEKVRVIGLKNAYHGDTIGTMAVGDAGAFHRRFRPWFFDAIHFPRPLHRECAGIVHHSDDEWSLHILRKLLERQAGKVAALIIEPSVQGAGGMLLHPPGFLRKVAGLCQEFSIHLICDEVFVGFGRTGPLLVCAKEGVVPDFLCLAKGLTAGYLPLAATVVREPVYEAFLGPYESFRAFFHGHTFTGNPLAAAVAVASLDKLQPMIESGSVHEKTIEFGRLLSKHLENHPHVGQIRHRGLCAAIDLVADRQAGAPFPVPERFGMQVCRAARVHGLLLRPLGDTLLLVPPISISVEEIRLLVERTSGALADALEQRQTPLPSTQNTNRN
ncbi:MAG: adenosylmethionine--8-amino-7-oxononanoate transaminase [Opitutales bacterium]